MAKLQQGSVVWAELAPPFGRRPVVILTRDAAIEKLNTVTIAPITRNVRNIPTEVVLEPADGLPSICAASLDNVFTIPKSALSTVIANLARAKMLRIFTAIRMAFDMP